MSEHKVRVQTFSSYFSGHDDREEYNVFDFLNKQ